MKNLWRSVTLAALAALLSTSVASAQETVTVTDVTFDKFQFLVPPQEGIRFSPILYVTGTITCDADGPQDGGWPVMTVTQRGARHTDNDHFGGVMCSTEPTPFRVTTESLVCESTEARADCLQPGAALVSVRLDPHLLIEQRVILRR